MAVYKDKKTGKYTVFVRYYNWKGEKKPHKREGFKTQREAKEYEREFLLKKSRDIMMGFGDFIDKYLEDIKPSIKPTTYETRKIRSVEVVKRGFMSNFLFQNISNIFGAPKEVLDIIQNFEPLEEPKSKVNLSEEVKKDLSLDENGEVLLTNDFVIGRTQDVFGDKIYDMTAQVKDTIEQIEVTPSDSKRAIDRLKEFVKKGAVKSVVETAQTSYGSDMKASDKRQIEAKLNHEADGY